MMSLMTGRALEDERTVGLQRSTWSVTVQTQAAAFKDTQLILRD